uniref:carbamoyl-phosphate synthase arginine-specific small subunit n=1 Tax=Grateloupia asiatica TaxID=151735 RepID=UPI002A80D80E|nr:carbamoyl-phosphate synthase arginine-specific small subunit [Grateloupia asiatica]WOL36789.1 carbamoyl-phosphate synthase arginine-specific small subunit [Grateloupia asiatica]
MNDSFYPAILYLEDGTHFKGWSLINSINCLGEVVFNTGMTGYQEIMTDPSYSGQIINFTYPEIGNTGLNDEDDESRNIHAAGIVLKNFCRYPSNWRSQITFVDYILKYKIPHIFGIDTRSLTKHLRNQGVMNGCISTKIFDLNALKNLILVSPSMQGLDLVKKVTAKYSYIWSPSLVPRFNFSHLDCKLNFSLRNLPSINIVVVDFGVKYNILSRLSKRGCNVQVVPASSDINTILAAEPDGILLSNGPGDPSVVSYGVCLVRDLIRVTNIPIFGICMGHQILSLALGANTFKLRFGHRGLNHPAGVNQKTEITSQNHGFAVDLTYELAQVTHFNLNDLTIAGILHANKPVFSVQYHPEANPGPHDSDYLFGAFIKLVHLIKDKSSIIKDRFI